MRRASKLAGAAAVIAIAAAGATIAASVGSRPAAAAQPSQLSTATVARQALSATVAEGGTLTYAAQSDGAPYPVINQADGTYTQLPAVGQVLAQGTVLYRVNGSPVVLLRGATPAYRTLSAGMTGRDVTELNADLIALGYASSAQLSPRSASFGPATTAALEKLQSGVGLAATGTLALGQAVFEPTAALRVIAVSAPLGGDGRPGQMLMQGSSTTRQVQVALDAAQETDVALGDRVSIDLPNNRTTAGIVSSVGTVATCPSSSGSASSGSGAPAPGTDSCSSASTTPTITVDVTPLDPAATGTWDAAPVQVGITTARVPGALVVPVAALLARAKGGYAVEVVGARANRLVRVSLGLFDDADGLVQVSGSRLAAGARVVVAST